MNEGRFEGVGGLKIFTRSWRPQGKPRGVVVIVARLQLAQRLLPVGRPSSSSAHGLAVYALDLRGRGKSDGERFYVEKFADYVERRGDVHRRWPRRASRACRSSCSATAPAACLVPLRARAPGRAGRAHLRELRVPGAGARLRAGGAQGAQPRRAARPRASSSRTRTSRAIRSGRRDDERRSADRARDAADADRGRDGPRRRAAEEGLPAHHAAGADPARHRRQGDQAERQPAASTTRPARRTRR